MSVTELEALDEHVKAVLDTLEGLSPADSFLLHAIGTLKQLKGVIEIEHRATKRDQEKLS